VARRRPCAHRLRLGVSERLDLVDGALELLGDAANALLVGEHAAGALFLGEGQNVSNTVGVGAAARARVFG
jgi:hypothetical protein